MSTANLINVDDPAWPFWEAMEHRLVLGGMSPLDRFSVLPYLLDLEVGTPMWRLNQQRAQDDFVNALGLFAIPAAAPLQDNKLETPAERAWFSFVDSLELQIAQSVLKPPLTPAW